MADDFLKLHDVISELIRTYEQKNILVKMQYDPDSDTIKIYGEKASALQRAKIGLEEATELAYSTAEHHPYWNLLYNGSQILKTILEKWNETLTEEDLKEINWYADEIKNSLNNVSANHHRE
jgi:hypothetical protein